MLAVGPDRVLGDGAESLHVVGVDLLLLGVPVLLHLLVGVAVLSVDGRLISGLLQDRPHVEPPGVKVGHVDQWRHRRPAFGGFYIKRKLKMSYTVTSSCR